MTGAAQGRQAQTRRETGSTVLDTAAASAEARGQAATEDASAQGAAMCSSDSGASRRLAQIQPALRALQTHRRGLTYMEAERWLRLELVLMQAGMFSMTQANWSWRFSLPADSGNAQPQHDESNVQHLNATAGVLRLASGPKAAADSRADLEGS